MTQRSAHRHGPHRASTAVPVPDRPRTPEEARAQQRNLATRVERRDRFGTIDRVAGVDAAYLPGEQRMIATAVSLDAATLEPVDQAVVTCPITFPYVPGLFSFRELPALAQALGKLAAPPDLVVCDGQGYAHPRRFGLACHLGVLLDVPTIGCGKTSLVGTHSRLAPERGRYAEIIDRGEAVGSALRTRPGVKPVYVSVGHRIGLASARAWILRLTPRYRLPETTRAADHLARTAQARHGNGAAVHDR